jgi:hypothetical protein
MCKSWKGSQLCLILGLRKKNLHLVAGQCEGTIARKNLLVYVMRTRLEMDFHQQKYRYLPDMDISLQNSVNEATKGTKRLYRDDYKDIIIIKNVEATILCTQAVLLSPLLRVPISTVLSSLGLSPSSTISFPFLPSLTHPLATQLATANTARHQNPKPTTPTLNPCPNTVNAATGNMLLLRCPSTVAAACTVPRTDGCGVQSLMRSVVAGVTPVLPIVKRRRTADIASQVAAVRECAGEEDATSDGYGATRYTMGNMNKADLQILSVPNRSCSIGYNTSWSSILIPPSRDRANPTSRGTMPRPPEKWIGEEEGGPTGAVRKMAQRLENVPRWPAIMKCESIVLMTLGVQIWRKGSLFFGG